ncbi:MAG: penicillin-binding protein activator [Rhizobiales bacterium]|nr:penicillin-binding protein activator [Hyphomicrobiales bacterium]NRB15272.1 penicillin-binding protein activator [Hyphomicrobiales bacterium]
MKNFSILRMGFVAVLALGLAACSGARFNVQDTTTAGLLTDDVPNQLIQDGNIRVGVVLPLGTKYGKIVKNALELAVIDNKGAKILMFIENSSTIGARSAARKVIAKGAEVILGPITSTAVRNVGVEARAAGIPVIAFSQDVKVAGNGIYLQSFLREKEIQKVVAFAASRGLKRFASLTPKSGFGQVVAAAFQQAASQYGSLVAAGTYTPLKSAASKTLFINDIKNFAAQAKSANADAILLPEGPSKNKNIIKVMESVGFKTSGIKFLGTSLWNKTDTNAIPQLAGSWFATANATKLNRFNSRYASLFGATPSTERAALAYDALSLVATLGRLGAAGNRFSPEAIARAGGFGGVLGHYSYNYGGVSNYSLNVMQVGGSGFKTVSSGDVAGN